MHQHQPLREWDVRQHFGDPTDGAVDLINGAKTGGKEQRLAGGSGTANHRLEIEITARDLDGWKRRIE